MFTDASAMPLPGRRALAKTRGQNAGPDILPPGARHSPLRRFFRRREIATAHRCFAMHMYLAGPHSALE